MSSRNAKRTDFDQVINAMKNGLVNPKTYISRQIIFDTVKEAFETWLYAPDEVIKAMIDMDG